MARKKSEPRQAAVSPAGTWWKTAIVPGSLTMHLAAIGVARTIGQCVRGATTGFGPADVVDTIGDRPSGLHVWTVGDPERLTKYRDWLLRWPHKPEQADPPDRLLGLKEGEPESQWLRALAAEGVRACWEGPIGIGSDDGRGPYLPVLVNRGEAGWAVTLPHWPRSNWTAVSVAVRAADLYHGDNIGDRSLRSHSWAVYPVTEVPTETLPA